ncbi:MAG: DMT family transporter, partial [Anaerolineae bacterium]|nr:DMT family transporter [Anaerolineae bacterium]
MKYWVMFVVLAVIWGSSFLLIKIGVGELDAISLVTARISIAALAFLATLAIMRKPLPRTAREWRDIIIVGITNTTLPFVLITWGEEAIDSGLAGVLNGTTPLFSLVLAHLTLHDDRINLGKILGIITGFAGVLLLTTGSGSAGLANPIERQLAILGASASYAFATVYMRLKLRHIESFTMAGMSLAVGAVAALAMLLLTVRPLPNVANLSTGVIVAVIVLGLLNTYIAYFFFFSLLRSWPPSRVTMVTWLVAPASL